ncbi:hypothetical protein CEXT_96301 [Caerostris extrusa]|uniref:Uncharacterized protein n=1 Tax=Caerostris extrusa TaxID=172846 RepID=A0AAV4P4A5_CAEEX|nr:hypothetical protein CEXT_96301 [Caerostris extrusa]
MSNYQVTTSVCCSRFPYMILVPEAFQTLQDRKQADVQSLILGIMLVDIVKVSMDNDHNDPSKNKIKRKQKLGLFEMIHAISESVKF